MTRRRVLRVRRLRRGARVALAALLLATGAESRLVAQEVRKAPAELVVVGESKRAAFAAESHGRPTKVFEVATNCTTKQSDYERVQVWKWNATNRAYSIQVIDIKKMFVTGDTSNNVQLGPLDVVCIPAKAGELRDIEPFRCLELVMQSTVDATKRAAVQHVESLAEADKAGKERQGAALFLARHHFDDQRRCENILALAKVEDGPAAVAVLIACLLDEPRIAREAATTLGILGPKARPALTALRVAASSKDEQLRERARAAIEAIEQNR